MPVARFQMEDGRIGRFEVPEGTTPEQAQQMIAASLQPSAKTEQPKEPSFGDSLKQELGNLGAGMVRGAGSIGATILAPVDAAARALNKGKPVNIGGYDIVGQDRRSGMDAALQTMGAEPDSLMYKGGKLAGEIAGTAGVPGMLAKGAQAARFAPSAVEAIRTAGMAGGSLPSRVAAGAATGGAMAGLANPEDAGTGALIGGALPIASSVASKGVQLGRKLLGQTTGVGDEAIKQAYMAGKAGGSQGEAFKGAMRGETAIDDVLNSAKQDLQAMGQQRLQNYKQSMAGVKADKTVLDMSGIDKSLNEAIDSITFKGKIKAPGAGDKLQQVSQEIAQWKQLNPAEYHTPEGLDALKQRVGDILESIPFNEQNARRVVGNVYNSIKGEISKQAPEYSKAMKDYSQASDLIKEIEKSLSLGQKSTAETGMRKLQSLMRNNVNTSYGYRTQLANALEQAGGKQIMPQLAGQALSDWTPRGIQRATSGTGSAALALTGNIPQAAGLAALSSPRLVGEAAYGAGKAAGAVDPRIIEALRRGAYLGAPQLGGE